jgi:hypothetical protein
MATGAKLSVETCEVLYKFKDCRLFQEDGSAKMYMMNTINHGESTGQPSRP